MAASSFPSRHAAIISSSTSPIAAVDVMAIAWAGALLTSRGRKPSRVATAPKKIYAQNVADAKRNTSSGNNEVDAIGSQSLRLRHKCCTALRCRKIGIDIGVTQIDGNNPIATGSRSLRCSLADAANAAGDERDEL